MSELVQARQRFISFHEGNGVPVVVEHRAVADKDHPVVKAQPDEWEPLTVDFPTPKKTTSTTKSKGD